MMRNKSGWIVAIVLGVILLLVIPGLWIFARPWRYGMMGEYGMMGRGFGFMNPLGWFGMGLMWLLPLALLVLTILGIAVLSKSLFGAEKPAPTAIPPVNLRACPNCGKSIQADWNNCPYCGQGLS